MRLGIMSFAHLHAEGYLAALRELAKTDPDLEVIGIADENRERGRYFAQQFDVHLFDSYEALLSAKPTAVIVCSENVKHRPLAELAAQAGAHVLCEKPLATNTADARAIVEACRRANVLLMTAFPMRFSAPAIEIKRLIESGKLGKLYGCNATNQGALPEFHQAENLSFLKRNWFVDKELAGGGALADHIVHVADLLHWYLNQPVTEVYAVANQIMGHVPVETGGLVMMSYADGSFASLDCSWNKPAYYQTWGGLQMELIGERGLATMDAFKQNITVYSDRVQRPQLRYWGSDANRGLITEFINAVREQRQPSITGEDGYKAVEIVEAAYRSVDSGQPVSLPL